MITTTRRPGEQMTEGETVMAKVEWLRAYAKTGTIMESAAAANVGRGQHSRWCEHDDDFRKAFEAAKEDYNDLIRAEIRKRAMEGSTRTKALWDRVKVTNPDGSEGHELVERKREVIEEVSDNLLMFKAKSRMPSEFRERVDVQVGWNDSTMDWLAGLLAKHIKDPNLLEAIALDMLIGPPSE